MTLPPTVEEGIERFNRGEYFEAHEAIEEAWRGEGDGERRRLWHGLVQLAVGFTHLRRGNVRGAVSLLQRGLAKLADLSPVAHGIDVAGLRAGAAGCLAAIEREPLASFDWSMVPRIERAERGSGVLS